MNLTLYIDESGDFETDKGEWVIAGLLCRGTVEEVDARLNAALEPCVAAGVVPPRCDCHLTDLHRSLGHGGANAICRRFMDEIFESDPSMQPPLLAAVNEAKRRVADPERTYRTMVLDLVALVDAAAGRHEPIDSFDLVIATRTRNSVRLTTDADLSRHFRDSIHQQFEVGLASRGLLDSFSSDAIRLHFRYANDAWGTVAADFLANTIFNGRHRQRDALLAEWIGCSRLAVFESLGGYAERRARVAERDGDLAAALGRWAVTPGSNARIRSARADGVERVWRRILMQTGVGGPAASLEAVIEWLRCQCPDRESLLAALRALEEGLASASRDSPHPSSDTLLFRLRNFFLLQVNQGGLAAEADRLIAEQDKRHPVLSGRPDAFAHVLDYEAQKVEAAVNRLDLETASMLAGRHVASIDNYLSAWSLFAGAAQEEPRWHLRGAMMSVRARALAWHGAANPRDAESALRLLDAQRPLHARDRSRLYCYRTLVLLCAGRLKDALACCEPNLTAASDRHVLLWTAHTITDCLLGGVAVPAALAERISTLLERDLPVVGDGHPADLLWRELGVLRCLSRPDRLAAARCFDRAIALSADMQRCTPIGAWLNGLARLHRDVLLSRPRDLRSYFEGEFANACTTLLDRCPAAGAAGLPMLVAVRRASPY